MLKVGLTGGIGSGKSTVTQLFSELGASIIDADEISRDLVKIGQPALALIGREFGADILTADGNLDRAKLKNKIFTDPDAKQQLEAILHPLVFQNMATKLAQLDRPYAIISVPLLVETGKTDWVDRVLVIDCPVITQIERVQQRDHLSPDQIQAIIANQATRAARLGYADDLIDNSSDTAALAHQVKKLHNFYLSLTSSIN